MTASAKAASNGSAITAPAPERKTGMDHVREAEAYHTASIAHDAAFEAERLCNDLSRTASDSYLVYRNQDKAVTPLTDPAMQDKMREAYDCLRIAQEYLRHLMTAEEPPF